MKLNRPSLIAAGVVSAGIFSLNVSAATKVLSDSSLLGFSDLGGTAASTLDSTTDISGNPGVQYDITWANQAGYTDIAIGKYSPTEIGIGDTWEMVVKNLDPTYPTLARLYMQVDGWSYYQGPGVWVAPGGGTATISIVNPATSVVNALGMKIGTDTWTGRPDGSSVSIQVIPEPSAAALLGIGTMILLGLRSRPMIGPARRR